MKKSVRSSPSGTFKRIKIGDDYYMGTAGKRILITASKDLSLVTNMPDKEIARIKKRIKQSSYKAQDIRIVAY